MSHRCHSEQINLTLGEFLAVLAVIIAFSVAVSYFVRKKDQAQLAYINAHHCITTNHVRRQNVYQCDNGQWMENDLRDEANK